MIICSNCGATNNEADGNICRKCGALLPISTKPSRIRLTLEKEKKETKKKQIKSPERVKVVEKPKVSDLQVIPPINLEIKQPAQDEEPDVVYEESEGIEPEKEILTEIAPKPFQPNRYSSSDNNIEPKSLAGLRELS